LAAAAADNAIAVTAPKAVNIGSDGERQKPVVLVEDGVAVKCLDKSASSVEIPSGVTKIGGWAFEGCKALASVVIPESVTEIDVGAFSDCESLASIKIGAGVTRIGWYAFKGCKALASVVIPTGVTEIDGAFGGCTSLKSISLPSTLKKIVKNAFVGCDAVESITSASPLFPFNEKTRKLYDATGKTKKVILVANAAKEEAKQEKIEKVQLASAGAVLDSIVQAHPVTNVQVRKEEKECFIVIPAKDGGMELCLANSKVQKWMQTLPVLLDKAANNATAAELREYAKANDLPDASRKYITVSKEGSVKLKKNAEPVYLVIPDGVTEIGYKAFRDCKSLSSVVIPESVKLIDAFAFRGCESLASIKIGAGVRKICCSAFSGCKALASVVIPASVTEIDGEFSGCKVLASVEFGGTVAQWEAVKKWVDWHGDVPAKSVKCSDGEAEL
jgi:hypothetical protein